VDFSPLYSFIVVGLHATMYYINDETHTKIGSLAFSI
jgi:hypothetical protein